MIFMNQLNKNCNNRGNAIVPTSENREISGEHEQMGTLPYSFYRGSAVVYNNEIHILGGNESSSSHYKWNGTSWQKVSDLPYDFTSGSAIVYNNEIHILGGQYYATNHYKWDGISWSNVGTLPFNFSFGVALMYNNKINIIGGETTPDFACHYSWDGSSWTREGRMIGGFCRGYGVVYQGKIHLMGTYYNNLDTYKKRHLVYDGTSWSRMDDLPYMLYDGSAIVFNNEIHLFGSNENDNLRRAHFIYDGNTLVKNNVELPMRSIFSSCVIYDNRIHLIGSSIDSGYAHYKIGTVEKKKYILISSKNSNVYSSDYSDSGDKFNVPVDSDSTPIFVYNQNNTKLLYSNQEIKYNSDSGKYEIYGYFPTTLKGTTVQITSSGWQTLQLDTPNLFKH